MRLADHRYIELRELAPVVLRMSGDLLRQVVVLDAHVGPKSCQMHPIYSKRVRHSHRYLGLHRGLSEDFFPTLVASLDQRVRESVPCQP